MSMPLLHGASELTPLPLTLATVHALPNQCAGTHQPVAYLYKTTLSHHYAVSCSWIRTHRSRYLKERRHFTWPLGVYRLALSKTTLSHCMYYNKH